MPVAEPIFTQSLLLKMVVVAAVVVFATMIAERTRPAIAALVATLPLSVGATYVLLAMEHDTAFVAAAALKSVPGAVSTTVFIVAYAHAVRRLEPLAALAVGYAAWLPVAWLVHKVAWTVPGALAFAAGMMTLAFAATYRLRGLRALQPSRRYWYDPLVRAAGVAVLVGLLTELSHNLGSSAVGTLANFPIIMSSVGLILHRRMGPEAAAGMLANSVAGMVGACLSLMAVHLTIERSGAVAGLLLGLAVSVGWNLMLFALGRRAARATALSRQP